MSRNLTLLTFSLILLTYKLTCASAGGPGWNYHEGEAGGPDEWHVNFTDCGGVMQSPIDIITEEAVYSPILPYFDFTNYRTTRGVNLTLINLGGHTAEVLYQGAPIYLQGGGLPAEYKLIQFHFHWGAEDKVGSEHFIDGEHFPMELHLVHQQKTLANLSVAEKHPFGLAVLGFFFQVSEKNNTKLEPLLKYFNQIALPDAKIHLDTFPLIDMLPENFRKLDFYRYYGSLTTPPCYETVIWSLATEYIKISESQLNVFRGLYESKDIHLVNDFRPVQPLNKRIVITTKNSSKNSSAQPSTRPLFLCLSLVLAWTYCRMP
nr:carbonic anhydrase 2-like [Biomphalaria glabrata]